MTDVTDLSYHPLHGLSVPGLKCNGCDTVRRATGLLTVVEVDIPTNGTAHHTGRLVGMHVNFFILHQFSRLPDDAVGTGKRFDKLTIVVDFTDD